VSKHLDDDPDYYIGKGGLTQFDVVDAFDLGYREGIVLKYLLRWNKKGKTKDLRKAINALTHMLQKAGEDG
jgi:hypothetical protein